ncbi:MAG TPA: hypothetical protein VJ083_06765 [Sedimentibacter sp.]|nr:hypothetical protein [Sedimentibacter sp.]
MKQKSIRLSRIKISQEMKSSIPRAEKLAHKYEYYKNKIRVNKKYGNNCNPLQSSIILDKHNTLLDGYTSYLIAKMFDIKKVDVIIQEND